MNYYDQGNEEEDAFEDGLWFAWSEVVFQSGRDNPASRLAPSV